MAFSIGERLIDRKGVEDFLTIADVYVWLINRWAEGRFNLATIGVETFPNVNTPCPSR